MTAFPDDVKALVASYLPHTERDRLEQSLPQTLSAKIKRQAPKRRFPHTVKFMNMIMDEHFDDLPKWVKKDLFYREQRKVLLEELRMAIDGGSTELNSVMLEIFATPLVSGLIDMGAGGGLDGKLDVFYPIPPKVRQELSDETIDSRVVLDEF
jgi:hypothetical protein